MNSPKSTFQTEHHVFIKVKVTGDSEQRVVEKEDSTWKDNAVYPRTELEMAEDPEKFNVPLSWTIKDNVVLCSGDVPGMSPQSSEETGKYSSQNTNAEHHLKEDGDAQHAKFLNGPGAQSKEITQIIDTKRRSPVNKNCKRLDIIHVPGLGYKCNICNKMFRFPSLVATHQKAHSGERPFSCSVCNKRFARKSDFVRHEWIHKRRSLFHCSVCGKGFNAPSRLQSHQKTHVEIYETNILNKKPTKLLNLYSCEECGKEFSYNWSLIRHQQVHIKNQYNMKCEKEKEMSYDCNTCGLTFTRHSYLLEHQKIHTGCVLHVCERCGKRFVSGASLTRHQKTHTEEQDCVVSPQSSEETGKYISQNTNAEHHLKEDGDAQHAKFLNRPRAQSKEITQIIDTKRRSPVNENCKRLEDIHVPGLGYKCNICNKMFRFPSRVATHQKAHSGERPFSCSVCNKRFARKSNFVRHEWIHKRRSLFYCSVCGKGFNAPSRLQSHQKTHVESDKTNILNKKPTKLLNPYSCEEMSYDCNTCGLTFSRHSYLLEHQQIHTGYVLHVCERCGKRFVSGGSLARHQKTHTEEQPYSGESGEISIDVSSQLKDFDSSSSFIPERTHTKHRV